MDLDKQALHNSSLSSLSVNLYLYLLFFVCFVLFCFVLFCFLLYFCSVSGGTGSTSFTSKRYLARGGKIKEGVTVLELPSTYYWRPVEKTNFTVGIVVADGDKEEMLSSQAIPSGELEITTN